MPLGIRQVRNQPGSNAELTYPSGKSVLTASHWGGVAMFWVKVVILTFWKWLLNLDTWLAAGFEVDWTEMCWNILCTEKEPIYIHFLSTAFSFVGVQYFVMLHSSKTGWWWWWWWCWWCNDPNWLDIFDQWFSWACGLQNHLLIIIPVGPSLASHLGCEAIPVVLGR